MTTLKDFFARHPRTALGFSGGTDSAYLLYAGTSLGADVRPYYIKTQFQPEFELADASRLARELGVELVVIEADILAADTESAGPLLSLQTGAVHAPRRAGGVRRLFGAHRRHERLG